MKKKQIFVALIIVFAALASLSLIIIWPSLSLRRETFAAPEASFAGLDEILSHPQAIAIRTYSTGTMQTDLSGIMNLEHEKAGNIEDKSIEIPVNVGVIRHRELGVYLIDAGLDQSYVANEHGTIKGLMVKSFLGKGRQEPGTHIAGILERDNIALQGVFLTHLHMDHTAGIVDLPKDIPYVAGENERYPNFTFIMQSNHLKGIDRLHELDFTEGIDLPPLGKAIDVFGDGSLWAIALDGHTEGHVVFLVNGIDQQVLYTGDACNDHYQFETGIGPGYYSSDVEAAQEALDRILLFKEHYPEVVLVYGHDLRTN